MSEVLGGTFNMGGGVADNSQPIHKVSIKAFYIAQTETTVLQWKIFCAATGRHMPEMLQSGSDDNLPISNIDWQSATDYCNWLSAKESKNYRLPTEAEWEFAARGGNKSLHYKYSGGNTLQEVGWYDDNSNKTAHKVASKQQNEIGIYDMSGNVWEWCEDWNGKYPSTSADNPKGPQNGKFRIVRGGGYNYSDINCLVFTRNIRTPNYKSPSVGFRVVCE